MDRMVILPPSGTYAWCETTDGREDLWVDGQGERTEIPDTALAPASSQVERVDIFNIPFRQPMSIEIVISGSARR
jgi:hypothetical protein